MPTDRRPARWGVRTLACLGLALLSIGISTVQGYYTLLTLTGLLIGLIGGMVCTVKGIGAFLK